MTAPTRETEQTQQAVAADATGDGLAGTLPAPLAQAVQLARAVMAFPGQAGSSPGAGSGGGPVDRGQMDPGRIDPEATGPAEAGLPVGLDVLLRDHSRQVRAADGVLPDQTDAPEQAMVDGVQAMLLTERWAQAQQLAMARALAVRAGAVLLARADAEDPQQLTPSARRRWRAQTKSVVANELATATGLGIQECHDRVGIALAPPSVVRPALVALEEGQADFRQVRTFWQKARHLRPVTALAVCQAVFAAGQSERPITQDEDEDEQADAGPHPAGGHWRPRSWEEFRRDLDREVTRAEGAQAQATRRRRAQRLQLRDASAFLEEAGTGTLTVDGRATSVAAAIARVDKAARRLRHGGDPRSLGQLRSDLTLALLVHGTLPRLPGVAAPAGDQGRDEGACSAVHRPTLDEQHEELTGLDDQAWQVLHALPAAQLQVIVPLDALVNPASTTVAAIRGSGHLPPEQVRELALIPGTTIHRLLTDPLDGRVVERTTASYRPDAAMTAQIIAADGSCRGPGCTRPPSVCERDHETPWGAHGRTSETNLNLKHGRHHWLKTLGFWHSTMDPDRTVRWTTFFGRRYLTRAHDYGQYLRPPGPCPWADPADPANPAAKPATADPTTSQPDPVSAELPAGLDPHTRDVLIYAALTHRGTGETLMAIDDDEDADILIDAFGTDLVGDTPVLQLRHHTVGGATRRGAPPDQPTPADVVRAVRSHDGRPEPDHPEAINCCASCGGMKS